MKRNTGKPAQNADPTDEKDDTTEVDLDSEELELEGEDEMEGVEGDVDEDAEDEEFDDDEIAPEDEGEAEPQARGRTREETVPKARLDEALTRNQVLEQVLARFGAQGQGQAQPTTADEIVEDIVKDLPDAEAKKWGRFVGHIARKIVEKAGGAVISPIQQAQMRLQEQYDETSTRQKYADYNKYEAKVNALRQEWYSATGYIAPREHAYWVVKGKEASTSSSNDRTRTRRKASASSGGQRSAAGKVPARRRNREPEHMPRTLAEVQGMDWKVAMKILDKNKVRI
jgi:hypothetical protein